MTLLINVIFFCQALILTALILTRTPARLPGFEKTRNQSLDKLILLVVISLLIILLAFKCR